VKKLFIILLFMPSLAFAGHTGWQSPTAAAGTSWTNPTYVYKSDNSRAYFEGVTGVYLYSTDYDLVIPNDSTIDSIEIIFQGDADAWLKVYNAFLVVSE